MGIATDLSRVKSNITAALSAIAEKGVTVPDGSNSDALASLIASIEAGGGYDVIAGTFTPASDNGTYKIIESGGLTTTTGNVLVKYGVLFSEGVDTDISTSKNYCSIVTFGDIKKSVLTRGYNSSYTQSEISDGYGIYVSGGDLFAGKFYGKGYFRAGITYRYAVVL